MLEEEELIPEQAADDGELENRDALLQQLSDLTHQGGPAGGLFRAGQSWLQGLMGAEEVRQQAAQLENQLLERLEDPLMNSQFDRLDSALNEGLTDQVLYALLGLGAQLKPQISP